MQKIKFFISIATFVVLASCQKQDGQIDVDNKIRYKNSIFTDVEVTSNIQYGSAKKVSGSGNEPLFLDLYQPKNDNATNRPIIICVHGGGFISGDKQQDNWPVICSTFAKKGFVVASINYRLGSNSGEIFEAPYRAQQDLRAAIRFSRKQATAYKLNANKIYLMGGSAGAITCINVGYKNDASETPSSINQATWGDFEGTSGNPGFPSSVNGIVGLWGSISDTLTINSGDIPIAMMHSINDQTVPYNYSFDPTRGASYGSLNINKRAKHVGLKTELHTYYYNGHGDGLYQPYLDTTINFTTNFIYELVK